MIVVSYSSCLIDRRKVSLLDTFLKLPYEILIPNTLFEEELLRFCEGLLSKASDNTELRFVLSQSYLGLGQLQTTRAEKGRGSRAERIYAWEKAIGIFSAVPITFIKSPCRSL